MDKNFLTLTMVFFSTQFKGSITVLSFNEKNDELHVKIQTTKDNWYNDKWILSHTLIGFNRYDYYLTTEEKLKWKL